MRIGGKAVVVAVLTALAGAGCSSSTDEWGQATPENQGYRWSGAGEPGNFGSAYSFCRSTLNAATEGQRLEGGAGVFGVAGGPNTIPGYARSAPVSRTSDYADRRQFNGCMASQGWVSSDQPAGPSQPVPAPQPLKP